MNWPEGVKHAFRFSVIVVSLNASCKVWAMAEVYKKIEKKIVDLKEKEEFWKAKYKEIAKQQKELVESNAQQMKSMQYAIKKSEQRIKEIEEIIGKISSKNEDMLAAFEKRTGLLSESAKALSLRLEDKEAEIKAVRSETASMVSGMIAKHERTFESVIEKINRMARGIQEGLQKEEGIYERMEATKKFMENYVPPAIPASAPAIPMAPPAPGRIENTCIPLFYEPPGISKPRRRSGFIETDVGIDDGPDVDDVIAGKVKIMGSSVDTINTNTNEITEKLAAIEENVSKMQKQKASGADRLEDKLQLYRESVAEMRSRMESIEKAMKDGMTPMMESMGVLVEAVKELKGGKAGPALQKPTPPKIK